MALTVNTNIASLNAARRLGDITERLNRNYDRLSSGLRIATASDDAAGLAISERLGTKVTGLQQAQRNATDGISLLQTAEGGLDEVTSILDRMKTLAVQSGNDTITDSDRTIMDVEFQQLVSEIGRIAESTDFGDIQLLDGTNTSLTFQVGAGTDTADTISFALTSATATDLGVNSISVDNTTNASLAITAIDLAVESVSTIRGTYGAYQNRLGSVVANLGTSIENLSASQSRIRDVDVASESADLTRNTILQQAAISVLSQANTQPQAALSLLG